MEMEKYLKKWYFRADYCIQGRYFADFDSWNNSLTIDEK